MRLIYNLFIVLYSLAARCLSVRNKKAKEWVKGRKDIFKQILSQITHNEDIIWFHCASLGEFEQARPLIEYIKQQQPDYKIFLTFFSPSGYAIQKNYKNADYVFYLPNDTVSNAKKFLRIVQPKYIFFIKYEFWYNYIYQAYRQKIPFYSVSCIFSEKQICFKWYGQWFRKQLRHITHFFTQDEYSKNLLNQFGISQASVCGDTRFDRVYHIVNQAKEIDFFADLTSKKNVIVAGSTWKEDEKPLSQLLNNQFFTLIIAPHEVHKERIEEIEKCFANYSPILYTKLSKKIDTKKMQVIVIDVIGILNSLYRYASIAYIGGGFGKGIHNILEAATYGKPVIFGPNYKKFKEANDLIRLLAAFSVSNYEDLNTVVQKLYANPQTIKSAGNTVKQYVLYNIGACEKIYENVFKN
jgi:3-deoxy-D-manno-octulosonic-acid transferase